MARRLTPAARRAEIIAIAQALMSEGGYRSLTMSEVARRCGMSTPGLMHYFSTLPELLASVLDARDEANLAAVLAVSENLPLVETIDTVLAYYDKRMREVRQYDALELEALDPQHPAFDHFAKRNARDAEMLRARIQNEFEDPDAVQELILLLMEAIRIRVLRDPDGHGMTHYWTPIRPMILALPRRR